MHSSRYWKIRTFLLAHVEHESTDPSCLSSIDEDLCHGLIHHHRAVLFALASLDDVLGKKIGNKQGYE